MTVVQFQLASMAVAEELIAEIWTCLEEYNIRSPALRFKFHDSGLITIAAHIDDAVAANTVLMRLSTQNLGRDPDGDPRFHILTPGGRVVAPPGWLLAEVSRSHSSHFVSRPKRK
jgi:hypothetical protein